MPKRFILTDRPAAPARAIAATAALWLMALVLSACATTPADHTQARTAAEVYEDGAVALEAGDYPAAIRHFQRLEALYPDDPYATQGQMELVFAYYQDRDPSSAVAAAGRFIRQHPDHPNLDYLYYLRGLARFDQSLRDLSAIAATTGPRPPTADLALQYFNELIGRYPQSRYSQDARNRVAHLRQQLAQYELEAAKLHMNRGEYTSAGLRARSVIETYPESGLATEAATIVNMANRMLNLDGSLRKDSAAQSPVPGGTEISPAPLAVPALNPAPTSLPPPPPTDPSIVHPPETTGHGAPQREDWINRQNGEAWTIQLFGTGNEQALLSFIDRHKLGLAAYFRTTRNQDSWYTLIYGAYGNINEARAAAERLPRTVLSERPWIRKISGIQASIKLEALEHSAQR